MLVFMMHSTMMRISPFTLDYCAKHHHSDPHLALVLRLSLRPLLGCKEHLIQSRHAFSSAVASTATLIRPAMARSSDLEKLNASCIASKDKRFSSQAHLVDPENFTITITN